MCGVFDRIDIRGECLCKNFLLLFAFEKKEWERRTRKERERHRDAIMHSKVIGGGVENTFLLLKQSINVTGEEGRDMSVRSKTQDNDIGSFGFEKSLEILLISLNALIDGKSGIRKVEVCRRNVGMGEQCFPDETLIVVLMIRRHMPLIDEEEVHFAPIDLFRAPKSRVEIAWSGAAGETERAAIIFRDRTLHCLSQSKDGKTHELFFSFGLEMFVLEWHQRMLSAYHSQWI